MKPKYKVGDWVKISNTNSGQLFMDEPLDSVKEEVLKTLEGVIFVVDDLEDRCDSGMVNDLSSPERFGYSLRPHPLFEQLFMSLDYGDWYDGAEINGVLIHMFYFENELMPAVIEEEEVNSADVL